MWPFTTSYTMLFHNHFPWGEMLAPAQAWLTHTGIYMCIYAAHPQVQSRSKPGTDLGWVTECSPITPHRCSPGPWLLGTGSWKPDQCTHPILSKTFSLLHYQFSEKERRFFLWQQGPKPDTGMRNGCRQGWGPLHTCLRPLGQDTATGFSCLHPSLSEWYTVRKEVS